MPKPLINYQPTRRKERYPYDDWFNLAYHDPTLLIRNEDYTGTDKSMIHGLRNALRKRKSQGKLDINLRLSIHSHEEGLVLVFKEVE